MRSARQSTSRWATPLDELRGDAADTRRRILDAATEEFSAHGLAGARVASIADRALANQRMIYAYFESKEGLFKAVIERAVLIRHDTVAIDSGDLVYAQAVFDASKAHPHLVRLALWQGLELPELSATIAPIAEARRDESGGNPPCAR